MPSMQEELNENCFAMFKGEPGTRKSSQAVTYPAPQYWFSTDWKMRALQLPMSIFGVKKSDIVYDDYEMWSGEKGIEQKLEKLKMTCPYKSIVIDSATSLVDKVLNQTITMKGGQTRQSGASAGKRIAGIAVNELEDYNAETGAFMKLITELKDIWKYQKVNIIIIAHVMMVTEKTINGNTSFARSIVTAAKRTAAKLPAYCDETYHFNVGSSMVVGQGGNYEILTTHTGDDFARTALPLPAKIEIGDKNLYKDFVLPAMTKLKNTQTI